MKKLILYFKIKKFYKIFGSELGSNFITKISDITDDNLHDVLFDINEVLETHFYEEAYALDAWLKKLYTKIAEYIW